MDLCGNNLLNNRVDDPHDSRPSEVTMVEVPEGVDVSRYNGSNGERVLSGVGHYLNVPSYSEPVE